MPSTTRIAKYRIESDHLSYQMMRAEQIIVTDGGPWAEHNVACMVCGDENAILDLNRGVFIPGDKCTQAGWRLLQLRKHWWQFWRRRD